MICSIENAERPNASTSRLVPSGTASENRMSPPSNQLTSSEPVPTTRQMPESSSNGRLFRSASRMERNEMRVSS